MRVALHSVLHPGTEEAYGNAHQRIPDDLAEVFTEIGIRDWTIWRSGVNLFHLVDVDDFDAAMQALEGNAANERWQQTIGEFVSSFQPAGGPDPHALSPLWSLMAQLASDRRG